MCCEPRIGLKQVTVQIRCKKTSQTHVFSYCRYPAQGQSGDHNRPSPCNHGSTASILVLSPILVLLTDQSYPPHAFTYLAILSRSPGCRTIMPIVQMKRLRHSSWELELRCTTRATYSQTLCFSSTSITSPPHLFSFQPPPLVLLLKQAYPSMDTTNISWQQVRISRGSHAHFY